MTKDNAIYAYEHATCRDIHEAYRRPSCRKENAFTHCRETMYLLGGHDGRITAAGCQFFSFAFRYEKDGKQKLHYITYANDYDYDYE